MVPALVLSVSFVILLAVGRLGGSIAGPLAHGAVCLRLALASMLVLTGWAHFGRLRGDLVRMVPPWAPAPGLVVTMTGVAELAVAAGLVFTTTAPMAAWILVVMLVLMFPANVHAVRHGVPLGGRPPTPLGLRTALQVLFLAAAIGAARWPIPQ